MDDENQDDAPRPRREAPIFKAPRQISRPKPPVQQEEMLGHENKMGDFEEVTALSVSEARAVVHAVHQARLRKDNPLGANRIHNDSQTINQFTEYLETFARFKSPDNLVAVSGVLEATNVLSTVEKAMLGSLACETAEEARSLIPSLTKDKISEEELQVLLDDMAKRLDRYG